MDVGKGREQDAVALTNEPRQSIRHHLPEDYFDNRFQAQFMSFFDEDHSLVCHDLLHQSSDYLFKNVNIIHSNME